ncbi:MAG: DMT family transporter [Calditrichota bacterium]
MIRQTQVYIYTALSILLWSTVACAFKLALREMDYAQTLFYASWTATLALSLLRGARAVQVKLSERRIDAAEIKSSQFNLGRSFLQGLLNPFLYYLVLFQAYFRLPAQEAQPLNWTWPITLALLSSIVFKQRLGWRTIIAALVSFSGVWVISLRGTASGWRLSDPLGDALAVGSSILWAGYWILNLKDDREPLVKLWGSFLGGSLMITAALPFISSFAVPTGRGLAAAVWIGLFEMGLTFILWLKALNLARDRNTVGILAYLTPFLSLIFIHYILGESIRTMSVIGLGLIIAGVLIQVTREISKRGGE